MRQQSDQKNSKKEHKIMEFESKLVTAILAFEKLIFLKSSEKIVTIPPVVNAALSSIQFSSL